MHDRDNPQRLFVGRISDKVIPRICEAQRARGEVGAAVALMRERDKRFDSRLNLINHSISGNVTVLGYEFPNSIEINRGFRVKITPSH